MLYSVAFLFPVLTISSLAWPFGVEAKMFADCTFGGMSQAVGDQKMAATFSGKHALLPKPKPFLCGEDKRTEPFLTCES